MELPKKIGGLLVILLISCAAFPALAAADTAVCSLPICLTDVTVTANDLSTTTPMNTSVGIILPATTSDGSSISYNLTTSPTALSTHGGVVSLVGHTSAATYAPPSGFTGPDTFTYQAKKGTANAFGTITIVVTGTADITPPAFTSTPIDQTFSTTTAVAIPTLIAPTATDLVDGAITPTYAPHSFSAGTTLVTWTATDAAGNHIATTSTVTINVVDPYRISSNTSSAITTDSFTATALQFDGVSAYVPASGAVIGVVLSSSTSTVIASTTADALGQATFTIATPGSYLIGLESDLYATTTPISVTAPVIVPTPDPVVVAPAGNGPPVANPVITAPAPTPTPASAPAPVSAPTPTPTYAYSSDAAAVLAPTPIADTTPAPRPVAVSPQPKVLAAETAPTAQPSSETPAAPIETPLEGQSAAAAAPISSDTAYELLGLIIVLLALAGLTWQWKKRNS
ncbi:MAG: hypothetical protein JWM46_90 [Candidatus Kaiserbacteria bacterium]|nr:hypothetical protein [Candidatus Kaiserbacteria bacterium]